MTPATLSDFIGRLFEIGFISQSNAVTTYPSGEGVLVEVGDTSQPSSFSPIYENSLAHYIDMFNEGKYSLIIFDGSLISIKYIVSKNGKRISWHRFVYFPAIVKIDVAAGDGPADLPPPDNYVRVPRQALLRFEYAPDDARVDHPASHLHLNSATCRMPMTSRLGVPEFLHFIIDNFYPSFREKYQKVLPSKMQYRDDLSIDDHRRFRVAAPNLENL
ncbi:DUF2290 domain-containing protein [Mesorhizobium koreense]|uniref:DUF2290 domain-containing protein n=1 Tax=Mesorhizobium koreense TaxID=3074855 RepID=UPI003530500F